MSKPGIIKTLANLGKRAKLPENKTVGYKTADRSDTYLNPLVTPPPRSPRSPEDFRDPDKLGHWFSLGMDYTSPIADRFKFHELMTCFVMMGFGLWLFSYGPDYKLRDWARREAFLRTHKREALGLPLIDRNLIDPDRIVLPTEEEIQDFKIVY